MLTLLFMVRNTSRLSKICKPPHFRPNHAMNAISAYDKAAVVRRSILGNHAGSVVETLHPDNLLVDEDVAFVGESLVQDLQELLAIHEVHWIAKPVPKADDQLSVFEKRETEG